MVKSKRIKWLDFAKGLAILGVVIGHAIGHGLFDFHVGIHNDLLIFILYISFLFIMPCFFTISGYLYKPIHSFNDFLLLIYKKITSIMIPYVIFTFILLCINELTYFKGQHEFIPILTVLHQYIYGPYSYLWFLYALFIIFLIIGLLDLLKVNNFIQFLICFILLTFQLIFDWKVGFQPQCGICSFIMFFWIGKILKNHNGLLNMINKYMLLIVLVDLIMFIILMRIYSESYIGFAFNDDNDITYIDFLPKLFSIPIIFWMARVFEHSHIFSNIFKYFDKYGKFTLIIYLVHYCIIIFIGKHLSDLLNVPLLNFIIVFIITWYGSLFVCYLSDKVKIFNMIFYPRKYINRLLIRTKFGKYLLKNK